MAASGPIHHTKRDVYNRSSTLHAANPRWPQFPPRQVNGSEHASRTSSGRGESAGFTLSIESSIMNYLHLPSSSRSAATSWNFPLGIDGFRYADLNRVRRLMAFYEVFRTELRAADLLLAERYELACVQYSRGE